MYLSSIQRKRYLFFYFICFAISYSWFFLNDALLSQLDAVFFKNRLDVSLNLLFFSGLHIAVIKSDSLKLLFDIFYLLLPASLLLAHLLNSRIQYLIALVNCFFNLVYTLLLSSLSIYSIEVFVPWILLPYIFAFKKEKNFYFAIHALRYLFLLIFFSSGVWKLRAGGLFNIEQMSAILAKQHLAYITANTQDWFTALVNYLIANKAIAYTLFLAASIAELLFIIGFFTKRFDKLLIIFFLLFVLFDFILMRINYFPWVAFVGCLWYSKYDTPKLDEKYNK